MVKRKDSKVRLNAFEAQISTIILGKLHNMSKFQVIYLSAYLPIYPSRQEYLPHKFAVKDK